jgi:hypothetical protein
MTSLMARWCAHLALGEGGGEAGKGGIVSAGLGAGVEVRVGEE